MSLVGLFPSQIVPGLAESGLPGAATGTAPEVETQRHPTESQSSWTTIRQPIEDNDKSGDSDDGEGLWMRPHQKQERTVDRPNSKSPADADSPSSASVAGDESDLFCLCKKGKCTRTVTCICCLNSTPTKRHCRFCRGASSSSPAWPPSPPPSPRPRPLPSPPPTPRNRRGEVPFADLPAFDGRFDKRGVPQLRRPPSTETNPTKREEPVASQPGGRFPAVKNEREYTHLLPWERPWPVIQVGRYLDDDDDDEDRSKDPFVRWYRQHLGDGYYWGWDGMLGMGCGLGLMEMF